MCKGFPFDGTERKLLNRRVRTYFGFCQTAIQLLLNGDRLILNSITVMSRFLCYNSNKFWKVVKQNAFLGKSTNKFIYQTENGFFKYIAYFVPTFKALFNPSFMKFVTVLPCLTDMQNCYHFVAKHVYYVFKKKVTWKRKIVGGWCW